MATPTARATRISAGYVSSAVVRAYPVASAEQKLRCAVLPVCGRCRNANLGGYTLPLSGPSARREELAIVASLVGFDQLARRVLFGGRRFSSRRMAKSSEQGNLGQMGQEIEAKIRASLSPTFLIVEDESHMHRGHAGVKDATGPETHFAVTCVSEGFEGKNRVARQRAIYALLGDEFKEQGLHALSLRCHTPAEWAEKGGGS